MKNNPLPVLFAMQEVASKLLKLEKQLSETSLGDSYFDIVYHDTGSPGEVLLSVVDTLIERETEE